MMIIATDVLRFICLSYKYSIDKTSKSLARFPFSHYWQYRAFVRVPNNPCSAIA